MDAINTVNSTVRATTDVSLSPARASAYRRLAVTVLGLDVPTLTAELRDRRRNSPRMLRVLPPSSRAA
jgi:hypothetical protein